jgi:hypothetical protein
MTTIKAFIKSHPLLSYFALTFVISWGGILLVVGLGPGGFSATPQQFQAVFPYALPAMLAGPSVAGILLTGLIDGGAVVSVALLCELLVKRRYLRRDLVGHLAARVALGCPCRATNSLQGAYGVGLRPYREPARGDAHARECHSLHDYLRSSGDIGVAFLAVGFAYAAATWVVVAAVSVANGGRLSRQPPLRKRVA